MEKTSKIVSEDAHSHITSIRIELCEQLFQFEPILKKEINNLPNFMSYILENSLRHCKIQDIPSTAALDYSLIHLDFVGDCLNDEFNTGHWRDVDLPKRKGFTIITCLKILIKLQNQEMVLDKNYIKSLMKCVDMGLLLGAPIQEGEETLLASVATQLMSYYNKYIQETSSSGDRKVYLESPALPDLPEILIPKNVINVPSLVEPRVDQFYRNYFLGKTPTKLLGCMSDWPANKKWKKWDYFIKICGERTVPVEVGSHYAHENWSQKLMTLREFILEHMEYNPDDTIRGYLAQHNLFEQIPELRNDIIIPDFCALSEDLESTLEPEINAWLGPKGTVSPLHYDPKHNILAQVIGSKQIILFDPEDSDYLYPHEELLLTNTAQVDPMAPDLEKFPKYSNARLWRTRLNSGEMLYIPPKWWHHVTSLEKSFSVSFWWE